MITVNIIADFIQDELAIAGIPVSGSTMKTEGKHPGSVFDAMIALEMEWDVDLSQATDEEYQTWALAELVGRMVRAEKKGKTIILEGEPLAYAEVQEKVLDFITRTRTYPTTIADNSESLIMGTEEEAESGE